MDVLDRVFLVIKQTCDYAMTVAPASDRQRRIAGGSRWHGKTEKGTVRRPKRSTIKRDSVIDFCSFGISFALWRETCYFTGQDSCDEGASSQLFLEEVKKCGCTCKEC